MGFKGICVLSLLTCREKMDIIVVVLYLRKKDGAFLFSEDS